MSGDLQAYLPVDCHVYVSSVDYFHNDAVTFGNVNCWTGVLSIHYQERLCETISSAIDECYLQTYI